MQLEEGQGDAKGPGGQGRPGGGFKRKRKSGKGSRLLIKAKKFGKQGRLGRGYEVDSSTYNYFLNVLQLWQKNEFESDEDKEAFVVNSLTQTEGNEINYSSNQMTSRVIETILPVAPEAVLLRFADTFSQSLRVICVDPFASHVLEKMLEITSSKKVGEESPKLLEWFRQTSKFVLNNFEEFTFDPYANHVMRRVAQYLTGLVQEESGHPGKRPSQNKTIPDTERKRSRKNEQIFADFYVRFLDWPQFFDLFKAELTCGLVQVILKACDRIDTEVLTVDLDAGIKKVLKALGDELDLSDNVQANLHTRNLEVCLALAKGKRWNKIYITYFKGKLIEFGSHEKGKFSVRKVIETCPGKEEFEEIFDELQSDFESVLEKCSALLTALTIGCHKFQTRQTPFLQSFLNHFGDVDENLIMQIARFPTTQVEYREDGTTPKFLTQLTGTMILQNVLEFHKPMKVISALLDLSEGDLTKLSNDPKGSHIFDSFIKSKSIGEKNKEKLLHKLKENLTPLALTKFGSRVIDTLWSWASMKNKATIAAALVDRMSQLNSNPFGKFISEKCALHSFKRDRKLWEEALGRDGKRQKEAQDILQLLTSKPDQSVEGGDDDTKTEETDIASPRKSKKKKKKHQEEESISDSEPVQEEEPTPSKRKRKKDKKSAENQVGVGDEGCDQEESIEEPEQPTKKKKKKKKSVSSE